MLWRYPRHTRRAIRGLIYLSVALFLLYLGGFLDFSTRSYKTWTWTTCGNVSPFKQSQSCTTTRSTIARNTQVILRTGGSEPLNRIHAHLATVLSQVPSENLLIFSDLEEEIDAHHVHDVYTDISEQERALYPEFRLYDAQKLYQQQGKDTRELQGGWTLGKYMNLPMKRKIWKMQQDMDQSERKKWFVFIETDTFMEWDNLFGLLEHLDPAKKIYIGSPVWLRGLQFAHGRSLLFDVYIPLRQNHIQILLILSSSLWPDTL